MSDENALRKQVCEVGKALAAANLVGACEGNISVRLDDARLLCTPSGRPKGELAPEELVVMGLDGSVQGHARPSSEIGLHLACLNARPDAQAVIHAHPPVATAFAVAGETIPDNVMPEAAIVLGPVALVPFGMTGTEAVGNAIQPLLPDHKTFLLANHGAVVLGSSLGDALDRMTTLERVAEVIFRARVLGGAKPIPTSDFDSMANKWLHGRLGA